MTDEGARAQAWRQTLMGLSIKQLSELTGYSVASVRIFEANANSAGKPIGEAAWRRYRVACAGVLLNKAYAQPFEWDMKDKDIDVF